MIPILSSAAMRDADANAARGDVDSLVRQAGTAVALEAKRLLGRCYAQRVAVVAGPGLNGADGRVAGAWLSSRGSHVDVIDVADQPKTLSGYDLVIDAAFGLGCSREYHAPRVEGPTHVLAVDLPSGVDADTGDVLGSPLVATATIALGALKAAHLCGPATDYVGTLRFAGLGIVTSYDDGLMEDADLATLLTSHRHDHKWTHAIQAFVGSPLMPGAAALVTGGALAGGASMIRLSSFGEVAHLVALPPEVVMATDGQLDNRCRATVAGPGIGVTGIDWLEQQLREVTTPVVLDADGLDAGLIARRATNRPEWILTPHDGEYARLTGRVTPANRFAAARELARRTRCVVLLKGPVTVVASPRGAIRVVNAGTPALATAGTGDVLAGLISATVARGHDSLEASALAAHLHGRAGANMSPYSPASSLLPAVREILTDVHTRSDVGVRSSGPALTKVRPRSPRYDGARQSSTAGPLPRVVTEERHHRQTR